MFTILPPFSRPGTAHSGGGGSSAGGGGGPPPAPPPDAEAASRNSASAVAHWEESKRLNGRIEVLRKKLAAKGEEAAEVQREGEKHRLMAEKMQVCSRVERGGGGTGEGKFLARIVSIQEIDPAMPNSDACYAQFGCVLCPIRMRAIPNSG